MGKFLCSDAAWFVTYCTWHSQSWLDRYQTRTFWRSPLKKKKKKGARIQLPIFEVSPRSHVGDSERPCVIWRLVSGRRWPHSAFARSCLLTDCITVRPRRVVRSRKFGPAGGIQWQEAGSQGWVRVREIGGNWTWRLSAILHASFGMVKGKAKGNHQLASILAWT